jgi:vacuolar-type H+-ATPase subunit H
LTAVNRVRPRARNISAEKTSACASTGAELRMPQGDGGSRADAARVDAAIAQVLQAERDAREDVQRCGRDAEATIEQAHERARQIARRAAHRSVRVQRWSATTLQRQLDELALRQSRSEQSTLSADGPGRLQQAVEALAVRLTGGLR